jgi:hypothetical protein
MQDLTDGSSESEMQDLSDANPNQLLLPRRNGSHDVAAEIDWFKKRFSHHDHCQLQMVLNGYYARERNTFQTYSQTKTFKNSAHYFNENIGNWQASIQVYSCLGANAWETQPRPSC